MRCGQRCCQSRLTAALLAVRRWPPGSDGAIVARQAPVVWLQCCQLASLRAAVVERSTVIALALLYRSTATVALTAGHDSNDHREWWEAPADSVGEPVLGVLVVVLRATMATAAAASAIIVHSPASRQCILAGSWGEGLPSFWCVELPERTERGGHRQFLVREEHAAQFGVEFPECAGANILSVGQTSTKATHDLKLVTVQLPAGYVSNTQAARPQRFVNERVQLTEAGQSDLARGKRKNQIVWGFRYRCGGIDTYVCVSDTALSASAAPTARWWRRDELQPAK